MKKIVKFAALLLASAAMLMVGCEPEPVPEPEKDPFEGASLAVKLVGADVTTATISVSAEVLKVVAYTIAPAEGATTPTAAEIFEKGTLVALEKEGATQVTLRSLEAETEYVLHLAGRISGTEVWDQVKEFKFKTAAEPEIPVLTAKLIGTDATSAEIQLYAENISRIAYLTAPLNEDGSMPTAPNLQVIFATGKVAEMVQGDNTLILKNLSPKTEYVAFIAGEIAGIEEYMEEVVTVKYIRTTDFADDITVRDIHYRGFTVDVKVDPSIKEQNHVIKWATMSLYTYRGRGGGYGSDAMALNLHDTAWNGLNLFNESRSLIIDEAHSYIYDSNGEIETVLFESVVPGQPQVVAMGEYRRGQHWGGWGYGYYTPMFDDAAYLADQANSSAPLAEAPYWTGFYEQVYVQVQKPEPLPEDMLQVEITPKPDDAIIKVTADESIDRVAIMIMSELEHGIASQSLEEEHMQWFATSLEAMYGGVTMIVDPYSEEYQFNGTIQTALSEYFYDIPRDSKYWVDVVGLRGDCNGDGFLDGHEQVYKKFEFYLTQPTKPAPEIVVTALESTSPYEVKFNVKCPTKDAYRGASISNYEKEWLMTGMSGAELLAEYGDYFTFNTVEIMQINSDEGLTVTYPSRPNENNYFAAMVANDEGTETYSDTVIARTLIEPAADKVDSPLFESLVGEWTASATMTYSTYNNETEQYEPVTATTTCNVTIGDFEYPEQLNEDVYATFQRHGVGREQADAYYAEFKAAAKTFNDNNRSQNRILMNGFNFTGGIQPYFEYSDPYSLFISDTYNGYTSEMPIYDFGPKWYLEVAADGTVTAPFNTNYFTPMSSWFAEYGSIYESHLIAYEPTTGSTAGYMGDTEGNIVNGHFPVEISEDGNTIVVKPMPYGDYNFYPNAAIYFGNGQYQITCKVISEITLTRKSGDAAPAAAKASKMVKGKVLNEKFQSSQEIKTPARPASRTAFGKRVEAKSVAGPKHFTEEQRREMWYDAHRN